MKQYLEGKSPAFKANSSIGVRERLRKTHSFSTEDSWAEISRVTKCEVLRVWLISSSALSLFMSSIVPRRIWKSRRKGYPHRGGCIYTARHTYLYILSLKLRKSENVPGSQREISDGWLKVSTKVRSQTENSEPKARPINTDFQRDYGNTKQWSIC